MEQDISETIFLIPKLKPKGQLISQRYVLGLMGFLGVVNAYIMRVVLSVAITAMTLTKNNNNNNFDDTCPNQGWMQNVNTTVLVNSPYIYNWNEETQGLILSSFYWGYILTHLPGGILAEKFGGKYTLGLGILSTSLFTLFTPVVVRLGNWPWLIVFRVFAGLGEGTTFPALNALLGKWVPLSERSTIGTLVYAGAQMGNLIGGAATGLIIGSTESWETPFYIFGLIGIIWFVFWIFLCYSEPKDNPFISAQERNYLDIELASIPNEEKDIPWRAVLTSVPLWALVLAGFGFDWGLYTMVTDLPLYMKSVLKFNVEQSGVLSSLPYLIMWIFSMFSAWICDLLIEKHFMTITFARKFFTTLTFVTSGIFLMLASYSGCDRIATVIFFTIGVGFMGVCYSGIKINALDLAPNYAGTTMAFVNGIGAFSGIISPYLTGVLTGEQTLSQWRLVFWITFVIFMVANIIFVAFGSGREQWWNTSKIKKGPLRQSDSSIED